MVLSFAVIFLVLENFAAILVQAVAVQPSGCTMLDLTFPVLINPVANRIPGVRKRTDSSAFPAVVIISIEIDLAPVLSLPVAVRPPEIAFFNITGTGRTTVLGMVEKASVPAGSTVIHIRHKVNAVICREDPAFSKAGSAGSG